jgi:hypothetical protein
MPDSLTNTNPDVPSESSIKNEDQFHDIIHVEQSKKQSKKEIRGFTELENLLHETLGSQDSEKALTIITK